MNIYLKEFKKAVFCLEKIKYKVFNKFHINNFVIKKLDVKRNKLLSHARSEEEKDKIISWYKHSLMLIKKENNREENINYHLDNDNPKETLFWLNVNKKIHNRSLKFNFIKLPIYALLLILSMNNVFGNIPLINILFILGFTKETISLIVNGSCVMLQNYNIDRVEKYIAGPYQKRKEKLYKKDLKYAPLTEVTSKVMDKSNSLPTPEEMFNSLTTDEQRKLFLNLVMQEIEHRKRNRQPDKEKLSQKKLRYSK